MDFVLMHIMPPNWLDVYLPMSEVIIMLSESRRNFALNESGKLFLLQNRLLMESSNMIGRECIRGCFFSYNSGICPCHAYDE